LNKVPLCIGFQAKAKEKKDKIQVSQQINRLGVEQGPLCSDLQAKERNIRDGVQVRKAALCR